MTETTKVVDVLFCCLQLNTGRGADTNQKVDYLGIDALDSKSMYFAVMPN